MLWINEGSFNQYIYVWSNMKCVRKFFFGCCERQLVSDREAGLQINQKKSRGHMPQNSMNTSWTYRDKEGKTSGRLICFPSIVLNFGSIWSPAQGFCFGYWLRLRYPKTNLIQRNLLFFLWKALCLLFLGLCFDIQHRRLLKKKSNILSLYCFVV